MSGHMGLTSLFVLEHCSILPSVCVHVVLTFSLLPSLFLCSTFLSEQLSQDVAEMLLVVQREVEEDGSWLNSDNPKK